MDSSEISMTSTQITVVIPVYRCKKHIASVLSKIPSFVSHILVIDDKCPEQTGLYVSQNITDPRVTVYFSEINGGVGSAMKRGFQEALKLAPDVVVKMDGDDQMDPKFLEPLTTPIIRGDYDYTKGNRFYNPRTIRRMPPLRIWGNAILSFFNKLSTGYYSIFDPNNGYVAISGICLAEMEIDRLSNRFFFESDLLFRLSLQRARVKDVPMPPIYESEESNLNEISAIPTFLMGHLKNFAKRITYNYFLRDFSVGSIYLIGSSLLLTFGSLWSLAQWYIHLNLGIPTPTGTIILGTLSLLIGAQLAIAFLAYDVSQEPGSVK